MPSFSARSRTTLDTCHDDLKTIANETIQTYEFSVLCEHINRLAELSEGCWEAFRDVEHEN